jgi:hypothetical protein
MGNSQTQLRELGGPEKFSLVPSTRGCDGAQPCSCQSSALIENLLLQMEKQRLIVDRHLSRPARWRGPLRREVHGYGLKSEQERYIAAYNDLIAEVVAHKGWKLDIPTLCQIHDRAVGGEILRKTSLSAGRHYHIFPEPEEIPNLLERLFTCLCNNDIQPVMAATLAHLDLLTIHPFRDGNGRTARLIATVLLVKAGFRSSLFTAVEQHYNLSPSAYIEVLDQFDSAEICHTGCIAKLIHSMAANSSLVSWFRARQTRIINALGEFEVPRHLEQIPVDFTRSLRA